MRDADGKLTLKSAHFSLLSQAAALVFSAADRFGDIWRSFNLLRGGGCTREPTVSVGLQSGCK